MADVREKQGTAIVFSKPLFLFWKETQYTKRENQSTPDYPPLDFPATFGKWLTICRKYEWRIFEGTPGTIVF